MLWHYFAFRSNEDLLYVLTMKLILYSSDYCPLCDQAEELIFRTLESFDYVNSHQLVRVNISDSFDLKKKYGFKVPVLARDDNREELYWPFDQGRLAAFIATNPAPKA